jgi:hypothetical protein
MAMSHRDTLLPIRRLRRQQSSAPGLSFELLSVSVVEFSRRSSMCCVLIGVSSRQHTTILKPLRAIRDVKMLCVFQYNGDLQQDFIGLA